MKLGKNVETANDMAQALMERGGLRNCLVTIGHIEKDEQTVIEKQLPKISTLFDFEFHTSGMVVRRHSRIGPGKNLELKKVFPSDTFKFKIVAAFGEEIQFDDNIDISYCKPPREKLISQMKNGLQPKSEEPSSSSSAPATVSKLFSCDTEFCSKKYIRELDLIHHQIESQCTIPAKTQETGEYFGELHFNRHGLNAEQSGLSGRNHRYLATYLQTLIEREVPEEVGYLEPTVEELTEMGFALEKKGGNPRHDQGVTAFLTDIYNTGKLTGKPMSATQAVIEIRTALLDDGKTLRFSNPETQWLEFSQVKSYFGRLHAKEKAKEKKGKKLDEPSDANVEEAAADYEQICTVQTEEEAIEKIIETEDQTENRSIHPFMVIPIFILNFDGLF